MLRMENLADPTRLRLLRLLERHELGVAELVEILQLPQSTVSRHLKVLADQGWLASRSRGTHEPLPHDPRRARALGAGALGAGPARDRRVGHRPAGRAAPRPPPPQRRPPRRGVLRRRRRALGQAPPRAVRRTATPRSACWRCCPRPPSWPTSAAGPGPSWRTSPPTSRRVIGVDSSARDAEGGAQAHPRDGQRGAAPGAPRVAAAPRRGVRRRHHVPGAELRRRAGPRPRRDGPDPAPRRPGRGGGPDEPRPRRLPQSRWARGTSASRPPSSKSLAERRRPRGRGLPRPACPSPRPGARPC